MKRKHNYSKELIVMLENLADFNGFLYPKVKRYRKSESYGRIKNLEFDTPNIFGDTPLKIAARAGNVNLVRELLALGADPNMPGQDMESPLHVAVIGGHAEIVEMLLAAGADPQVRDIYGKSPVDWAVIFSTHSKGDSVEVRMAKLQILEALCPKS